MLNKIYAASDCLFSSNLSKDGKDSGWKLHAQGKYWGTFSAWDINDGGIAIFRNDGSLGPVVINNAYLQSWVVRTIEKYNQSTFDHAGCIAFILERAAEELEKEIKRIVRKGERPSYQIQFLARPKAYEIEPDRLFRYLGIIKSFDFFPQKEV